MKKESRYIQLLPKGEEVRGEGLEALIHSRQRTRRRRQGYTAVALCLLGAFAVTLLGVYLFHGDDPLDEVEETIVSLERPLWQLYENKLQNKRIYNEQMEGFSKFAYMLRKDDERKERKAINDRFKSKSKRIDQEAETQGGPLKFIKEQMEIMDEPSINGVFIEHLEDVVRKSSLLRGNERSKFSNWAQKALNFVNSKEEISDERRGGIIRVIEKLKKRWRNVANRIRHGSSPRISDLHVTDSTIIDDESDIHIRP